MGRYAISFSALVLLAGFQAFADVELVLEDGRHLAGSSVERRGDFYLLELAEGGRKVTIPGRLVREIRLTGVSQPVGEPEEGRADQPEAVEGVVEDSEGQARSPYEATRRSGETEAVAAEAEEEGQQEESVSEWPQPAAAPGRTATPAQQLAAFGREPAYFATAPVSPTWRYEDVLGYETDVTEFNPARWYRAPYDARWQPTSGYESTSPIPDFNPSRWYQPPLRHNWYPRYGWGPTVWFPPVVYSRD